MLHHIIYITSVMCSKCPPPARTQAYRHWRHSAVITFNNRVTPSGPLAVDVSFQFVVRDLLRSGELRSQRAGEIKSIVSRSSSALARCDGAVLLKNEKLASGCCTNVRKQHVSEWQRDSSRIDVSLFLNSSSNFSSHCQFQLQLNFSCQKNFNADYDHS